MQNEPSGAGFDAAACREELERTLTGSRELDELVSQISVYDSLSIVTFGSEAAQEVARCSDEILRSVNGGQVGQPGPFLEALSRVMEQFDPAEAAGVEKRSVFPFLSKRRENAEDRLLAKYRDMGQDVDKLYIQLKTYEAEVSGFQDKLTGMMNASARCYRQLYRYILAARQGLQELDAYLAQMAADSARRPGDMELQMDLTTVRQSRAALERRTQDLHIAEILALQSLPVLQTMIHNNSLLLEKLNSAFLVTLPVFRQALAMAVQRKRQRLQEQALQALDRRVREQYRNRPQPPEEEEQVLEQTWQTIRQGIRDTRALQDRTDAQQAADAAQLTQARQEFQAQSVC